MVDKLFNTRSPAGCSVERDEKLKIGWLGMLPEKRSHAGSGGGVGDVRFEMVGCVYWGALVIGDGIGGP